MTRLLTCIANEDAQPWVDDLRTALPDYDIQAWQPGAKPADYAIAWKPPQQFIDEQAPHLKALFNAGAGVDALLSLALPHDLQIVRLDDAGMAIQMVDYVCHAVIRHYRGFDIYQDSARSAAWHPRPLPSRDDYPVGILGLGVLGQRVAQALEMLEFPVVGWSRSPKHIGNARTFCGDHALPAFLSASRVLVNLLPLTDATRGILNRNTLGSLQAGGFLINIARGAHLVEEDLVALIDSGHLAGAVLDVFHHEPLPPSHPFWHHPKISVTPHIAASTPRHEAIAQICRKLAALAQGAPITGLVDRDLGY